MSVCVCVLFMVSGFREGGRRSLGGKGGSGFRVFRAFSVFLGSGWG